MAKKYYTSRVKGLKLNINDLYYKLQNIYLFFKNKDYFKDLARITKDTKNIPDAIKYDASIKLSFQPFPITKWEEVDVTENNLFDVIEFFYDYISKPGDLVERIDNDSGYNYRYLDYDSYDREKGKKEYIEYINIVLNDYADGYELSNEGEIISLGENGLKYILNADIVPYDDRNVDSRIADAIKKWLKRNQSLNERKETIRILADVFEWLKRSKKLQNVLDKKDDKIIFEIINEFEIRHHNPNQKSNYDKKIWYSWMFHFYLATYHAIIRLLIKSEKDDNTEIKEMNN